MTRGASGGGESFWSGEGGRVERLDTGSGFASRERLRVGVSSDCSGKTVSSVAGTAGTSLEMSRDSSQIIGVSSGCAGASSEELFSVALSVADAFSPASSRSL